MFTTKDYLVFFDELYRIEKDMEQEMVDLRALIKDKNIQSILKAIEKDEQRHALLVKQMIKLVS